MAKSDDNMERLQHQCNRIINFNISKDETSLLINRVNASTYQLTLLIYTSVWELYITRNGHTVH